MNNNQQIDFSVFRKDALDKSKLKNAKKRFKKSDRAQVKPVTIFKEAN